MKEYIYPETALPEIEFTARIPNPCGRCGHGVITNAGSYRPGYKCLLIERLFTEKGITNGNSHVDQIWNTCNKFISKTDFANQMAAKRMEGAFI